MKESRSVIKIMITHDDKISQDVILETLSELFERLPFKWILELETGSENNGDKK